MGLSNTHGRPLRRSSRVGLIGVQGYCQQNYSLSTTVYSLRIDRADGQDAAAAQGIMIKARH